METCPAGTAVASEGHILKRNPSQLSAGGGTAEAQKAPELHKTTRYLSRLCNYHWYDNSQKTVTSVLDKARPSLLALPFSYSPLSR